MTDPDFDANRVLTRACDDGDRPYDYSIDTVLRRGRRRVLVRNSTGAAASAVAVGAIAVGATQLTGSGRASSDDAPVASSSAKTSAAPSAPKASTAPKTTPKKRIVPPAPVAKMSDREIIRRCKVLDEEFLWMGSNKAGGGTDPLDDWSVLIKEAVPRSVHAVLVSPDRRRFAYCHFDVTGREGYDDYARESVAVSKRDYQLFTAGLGAAAGPIPSNVARITFQISDTVYESRIKDGFVLWRRPDDSMNKPIWANFYDASGKRLARFDTNPSR